ncbi:MAG: GH3 auxin-responsive promoter family protein [Flavobacteriales bacterium]|nr:GH3 auxin-responsive promoter family protein [Flavobacteriales bacterium]
MAFIGTILQESIKLKQSMASGRTKASPLLQQYKTLEKLITYSKDTAFGEDFSFPDLLKEKDLMDAYRSSVPVFNYESMLKTYWSRILEDQENICRPGKTKFFALTSGTSDSASKRVPVTTSMIKAVRKTSIRQMLTLSQFDLPGNFYEKGVLMLGGSTKLQKIGQHDEGDLSGILAGNIPLWFYRFYKPGRKLAMERDWQLKLDNITKEAASWNIGIIAGVPAWVQILMERIIDHYKVKHIHEIWPNLKFFVHGGVSFEPYRKGFNALLGEEINYLETYLASEGFLAFQNGTCPHMQLVLDNGIYFEFIPYNDNNFDDSGNLKPGARSLHINEVDTKTDYAIIITTCAGAYRYLIGDTIRFISTETCEIKITGRTKHFLSLCGEHLSVDNMNTAIKRLAEETGQVIREYTVTGIPYEGMFAHQWYIAMENPTNIEQVQQQLDRILCQINDDYAVERKAALKAVMVKPLQTTTFYRFLKTLGKEGGQNKFPRVLKGALVEKWQTFLNNDPDAR